MSLLKQLIEIQDNKKNIAACSNLINNHEYASNLKGVKKEFDIEKSKFKNKDSEISNLRNKYQMVSSNLNNDKDELEKIKFELYNNAGSDLKLIDALQKKFNKKQESIKIVDNQVLKLLEQEEKLSSEKESLKIKLSKLKNDFYTYKNTEGKKINDAREKIKKSEEAIKELEKLIPVDILEIFNKICSSKGTGAAELKDNICSGCRVKVSSMTIDNVNKQQRIVYCDNCGRIIYCNEKKSF